MTRTFDDRPAVREKTPLLVGLVGPSGTGKTYSALRMAAGIQRVTGGDIFVADTEMRRALHYADRFKFRHVAFAPPHGPQDYLEVFQYCEKRGASILVCDQLSYEHDGIGGVLEQHATEHARMGGGENTKMLAWSKPKQARRKLLHSMLQMNMNFVLTFRAKEKVKVEKGKITPMGYCPIAGEEFMFELTLKCLLLPGANGTPVWKSDEIGERAMIKLPEQFLRVFANSPQITEDIGEMLARWAAGGVAEVGSQPAAALRRSPQELQKSYEACGDAATFRALEEERAAIWKAIAPGDEKTALKKSATEAEARLAKMMADADAAAKQMTAAPTAPDAAASDVPPEPTPPPKPDLDADIPAS